MAETAIDAKKCYEDLKDFIAAVPEARARWSTMSDDEAVAEVNRVVRLTSEDYDRLAKSGIDPKILDAFPNLARAFAYTAVTFNDLYTGRDKALTGFAARKDEGFALRMKLLETYEYVFRAEPTQLRKVTAIREGQGNKDMVLDLLAVAVLGDEQKDTLQQSNVDVGLVGKARTLHHELAALLAEAAVNPVAYSAARTTYNKAWTRVAEALSEIYAAGRFVFMDEPARRDLYRNDYYRRIGAMNTGKAGSSAGQAPVIAS